MARLWWTCDPNSLGPFLALVLMVSSTVAGQGQDITLKNQDGPGREAFTSGKYKEAVPFLRLALEQAITDHASDTRMVLALNDLAEALRLIGHYDESEKLFDRAIAILRNSNTAESRYKPIILSSQGKLYLATGRYALSESSL